MEEGGKEPWKGRKGAKENNQGNLFLLIILGHLGESHRLIQRKELKKR